MRVLGWIVVSAGVLACAGCHSAAPVANAASNDFPVGTAVYTRRDHAYAGKVVKYEPNHVFPNGETATAVLISGTDGQAGWYRANSLPNSFTNH